MEITVEMSAKTSREYNGRVKWGVHPKGSPKDFWVDIYYPERPKPGQVFNIGAIKETKSNDGAKIFREAEIIGAAEAQTIDPRTWPQPPSPLPPQVAQSYRMVGNMKNAPPPGLVLADQPSMPATPPPSNGKIKWDDWATMTRAAHELAMSLEGDGATFAEARAAIINTIMIAFSQGKLELPTEAGPVSREPSDDDDAYADPNKTVPWDN